MTAKNNSDQSTTYVRFSMPSHMQAQIFHACMAVLYINMEILEQNLSDTSPVSQKKTGKPSFARGVTFGESPACKAAKATTAY